MSKASLAKGCKSAQSSKSKTLHLSEIDHDRKAVRNSNRCEEGIARQLGNKTAICIVGCACKLTSKINLLLRNVIYDWGARR